ASGSPSKNGCNRVAVLAARSLPGANSRDAGSAGGGVVAVHKAFAIKKGDWDWYDRMIGRSFRTHPYLQTAMVDVVDATHPATAGLPERWLWSDEWYEYDPPYSDDLHVVMEVDERSYAGTGVARAWWKSLHPALWALLLVALGLAVWRWW
ncbi:hypothetical protein CWM66_28405, partial [Kosakonia sp. H7A]|uniref:ThuA domain-containing protein n=1 Tax=Kosakonia sp. H7A TaxID=2054598 RepID=UPI000D3FCBD6